MDEHDLSSHAGSLPPARQSFPLTSAHPRVLGLTLPGLLLALGALTSPVHALSNGGQMSQSEVGSDDADHSEVLSARRTDTHRPSFLSNSILVKLTAGDAARLRTSNGAVNPLDTGLASLDSICEEHGVRSIRSVGGAGTHRDPRAAIFSWYELTTGATQRRLVLPQQGNDLAGDLTSAGAASLGRLMTRLEQDSSVASVVPNYVVTTQFVPNDPYYSSPYPTSKYGNISQWAPQHIGAPNAWDSTQGDPSIVIAIVDTGLDLNHPDLVGKIVSATNYVKGEKASDSFGHGTHVAGIAAANTNNGIGVAGICPRCSLMSVKVLGADGSGSLSAVASDINYATDHGARVINLSLGGPSHTALMRDALDYALNNNAVPVAALGNSGNNRVGEPAYWYSALSVGAIDQQGQRASFSTFGLQTDVTAPGVAVLSTMPTYATTLNTRYGYKLNYDALSGTSMATPVVAGLAGLVLSRNPALTAAQVKGIIEASAGDGVRFDTTSGFGLVHAAGATTLAEQAEGVPPALGSVSPPSGTTLVRNVAFSTSPTDNVAVHHVDFVKDGARFLLPGTAVGYSGGGGKKNPTPSIAPWSSLFSSTTVWNGPVAITTVAFDRSGNATANARSFNIENAYVTRTFSTHICDPSRTGCPKNVWDAAFSLTYPAVAKERVEWTNTTFSSNYAGDLGGQVTNGQVSRSFGVFLRYWTGGNTVEHSWDEPVFCGGCSTNRIGAELGNLYLCINRDCPITAGTAETDITVTVTYPQ